jgi:hypothetical protein
MARLVESVRAEGGGTQSEPADRGGKTLALDKVQLTVGPLDEEWFGLWLGCGTLHFQLDQV